MAWTEQDYQEIVARLMAESIGVNEVPDAESTDDISSLPAYQPANGTEVPTVVKASLELLVAPALEAADKANAAATKAEENATAAQTAANTANEKAELAAQAASDANAAKEGAETATQSANNAASNAEEKAEAANTAAQDAEKVANNPTYIGTDHYVYVYNKETDSFDKTGIYCKGEPGSSFRVAGEYATLEALKSAVPDGSTIDGFMAVGTEAPYDYYAWVNGNWVNQGKIAGGGSGNVVVIPAAAMSISDQATSDEIFNAFGGKDAFMDICQSIVNKDTVCVVANIPEESGMKLVYIPIMAMATYTDANNANFMMAIITETTFQLVVTVTDGVATHSSQVLNHIYEAPSDGNAYGRKNKGWAEVPEKSDVLTKDNETEYTPTEPYNPATKKYVDDTISGKVKRLNLDILSPLVSNISITETGSHTQVDEKLNQLFGSVSDYRDVVTRLSKGELSGIEVYNTNNLATNLDTKRIIFSNICAVANDEDDDFRDLYATYSYLEYTKRIIITYRLSTNEYSYKIDDLVSSNNITNITQMTSSQYEQLSLKSSHTMYAITD